VINTENYVRKFANTVLERDGRYLSREKMNPRNFFGELKRRNVCENMHRLSHRRLGDETLSRIRTLVRRTIEERNQ
jgi:hypothetical protein